MTLPLALVQMCVRIALLGTVFAATLFKDYFKVPVLYWTLTTGAVALNIVIEVYAYRRTKTKEKTDKIISAAQHKFTEGHYFFQAGIRDNSAELLEQSIVLLQAAADQLDAVQGQRFRLVSVHAAIALAREKLAYRGSTEGRDYHLDTGVIHALAVTRGDTIRVGPTSGPDIVRATNVSAPDMWLEARQAHERVVSFLGTAGVRLAPEDSADELVSAARNAGYFFLCDVLENGAPTLAHARAALDAALSICKHYALPARAKDIEGKLRFVTLLEAKTPVQIGNKVSESMQSRLETILTTLPPGQLSDRATAASKALLGYPYRGGTLVGSRTIREHLVVTLDGFDCVTYCETTLALAAARTFEQLEKVLIELRYADGVISWESRNHYFSSWIDFGLRKGLLATFVPVEMLNVRIGKTLSLLEGLPPVRASLQMTDPKDWRELVPHIRNGDIVAFGSTKANLDVFHCGLLFLARSDHVVLRHCGKRAGAVADEPLEQFLSRNQVSGLILARPIRPAYALRSSSQDFDREGTGPPNFGLQQTPTWLSLGRRS